MAVTLLLARHGQTHENVARILQGQMPGHLNEEGISQAHEMGRMLQSTPIDAVLTSDLKRAVDTAHIVNEYLHLPLIKEPLLRERNFGIHTGAPYLSISGDLDPSAETVEAMFARAQQWLRHVALTYDGKTVLAVSHGLFLRVIQGAFLGKTIRDIPRMDNAEVRTLIIDSTDHLNTETEEVGAKDA